MIQKQFEKLMALFEKGAKGETVNMEDVLKETVVFFEALEEELSRVDEEDRPALMKMVNEMYEKINQESKRISEKTGMSEDELLAFSENSSNFSEDQWHSVQSTRRKMMQSGRKISRILQKPDKGEEGEQKPRKPKKKRAKKSSWTRS